MLKQIFITSAILIATMSQKVSSPSALATDFLNLSPVAPSSEFIALNTEKEIATTDNPDINVESVSQETFEYYMVNFTPFTVYITLIGPTGRQNFIVPPATETRLGDLYAQLEPGNYQIFCSTDNYNDSYTAFYRMSCGYSATSAGYSNYYMFSDIEIGPFACTSIDVEGYF